jgi:hypothetical protein
VQRRKQTNETEQKNFVLLHVHEKKIIEFSIVLLQ